MKIVRPRTTKGDYVRSLAAQGIPIGITEMLLVVGEYSSVLGAARREGWLTELIEAHQVPCNTDQASRILRVMRGLPRGLHVGFRNKRGWTRERKDGSLGVYLPFKPGTTHGHLRVGLVLHEASHILDYLERQAFGHGPAFQARLREAIHNTAWRSCVTDNSIKEIYARHRGPFQFLLSTRLKNGQSGTKHDPGPFSAKDAHAAALDWINKFDDIEAVFVFSKSEGQFTGAFYKKGGTDARVYRPWHELEEPDGRRVELHRNEEPLASDPAPALLSRSSEPVQEMDAADGRGLPAEPVPQARPVRNLPAKEPTQPRAQRAAGSPPRRASRALEVNPDKTEGWPKSEGAGIVRAWLEEHKRGTPAEIVAAVGPRLIELNVQFPASLISRLKQGGLLREAHED